MGKDTNWSDVSEKHKKTQLVVLGEERLCVGCASI